MAKYKFFEDWSNARTAERFFAKRYARFKCDGDSTMECRLEEERMTEWEALNPKPEYTRDELLIEIANRLNILLQ